MDRNEGELEAAGEEADDEQHVAAMRERLRQGLLEDCGRADAAPRSAGGVASTSDSGSSSSMGAAKTSSAVCQSNASISARASGENRNCPNEPAAVPAPNANERQYRHQLAERADHDGERAAGEAEADQHAGRDVQRRGRGRIGHQGEAKRVQDRADADNPHGAEAVGDAAGERLDGAPEQVLDRDCEQNSRGPSHGSPTAA